MIFSALAGGLEHVFKFEATTYPLPPKTKVPWVSSKRCEAEYAMA